MLVTLLSFWILFSSRSPCLMVVWGGRAVGMDYGRSKVTKVHVLYLIQEVLAIWSVGLYNSTNFVDATVETPRGYESRELPTKIGRGEGGGGRCLVSVIDGYVG